MPEIVTRVELLEAESPERVLADLHTGVRGLSSREAQRRLLASDPNELTSRTRRSWPRGLAAQFTHPLAVSWLRRHATRNGLRRGNRG